ncbi:MAG: heme peroxidase-related protein [Monoraphidium minutum]|nr:MAG: heme peroxidase-related protein [Monoraphidium minutum]
MLPRQGSARLSLASAPSANGLLRTASARPRCAAPASAAPAVGAAELAAAQQQLRVPLSDAERAAPKSRVCVTGAGSYVGTHVVQRLLAAGHTVHAAVRSSARAAHLRALPGAGGGRLRFFEGCDLTAPGSYDAAMADCDFVMHHASPFTLGVKEGDVRDALLKPAVEGTKNVLASVERSPSVRRVVVTSSIAAVLAYPLPGYVYSEDDWNEESSPARFPYDLSKALAERAAWEAAARQDRWSLVSVNPGLVMGPPLGPQGGESVSLMTRILRGDLALGHPDLRLRTVDVRDVAKAHCVAMADPNTAGRYLLAPNDFSFPRTAELLRAGPLGARLAWRLPGRRPAPRWLLRLLADAVGVERCRLEESYGVPILVDCSKAQQDLGLSDWIPEAETYEDMAAALIAAGAVPGVAAASARAGRSAAAAGGRGGARVAPEA